MIVNKHKDASQEIRINFNENEAFDLLSKDHSQSQIRGSKRYLINDGMPIFVLNLIIKLYFV